MDGIQLIMRGEEQRKRFTAPQKLEILPDWQSTGNGVDVSRQHGIHPMTLYRWRKRLEHGVAKFLKGSRPKPNPRSRNFRERIRDSKIW